MKRLKYLLRILPIYYNIQHIMKAVFTVLILLSFSAAESQTQILCGGSVPSGWITTSINGTCSIGGYSGYISRTITNGNALPYNSSITTCGDLPPAGWVTTAINGYCYTNSGISYLGRTIKKIGGAPFGTVVNVCGDLPPAGWVTTSINGYCYTDFGVSYLGRTIKNIDGACYGTVENVCGDFPPAGWELVSTNGTCYSDFGIIYTGRTIRNISGPPCCLANLTITTNVTAPGADNKQASGTIIASNSIGTGATAIYHAGNEVLLNPGFEAVNGSSFKAYIEGCTGNYQFRLAPPDTITYAFRSGDKESAGAKRAFSANSLLVSPNPFTDKLNISYYLTDDNDKAGIEVYSIMGMKVADLLEHKQIASGTQRIEWNAGNLPGGMYLIVFTTNTGKEIEKVVKR